VPFVKLSKKNLTNFPVQFMFSKCITLITHMLHIVLALVFFYAIGMNKCRYKITAKKVRNLYHYIKSADYQLYIQPM